MADVLPILQYGPFPEDGVIIDEPSLLVQSVSFAGTREKKAYKGGSQVTRAVRYTDPMMKISISAIISEFSGLADQHPGTTVTELLNYAGPIHGFDPEQGIMVYEDPVRDLTLDDPAKVKFEISHMPFIEE